MTQVLIAIAIIGAIGLLGGALLSVISALCDKGEENERLSAIRDALPGANCGACGFAGCDSYAEAVENGSAEPNLCAPGGTDAISKLSEILGIEIEASPKVAKVLCAGCSENVGTKYNYTGMKSCKAAFALGGGMSDCNFGCLGLGDCANICPFDAINIKDSLAVVDTDKCTGCGKCTAACPKAIISLVQLKKAAIVPCSNHQKGGAARKVCKTACIGCSACVRACEFNAVSVNNFLAEINAENCTACGKCADACPQKIIVVE